ncbi:serine--tRNA ligase [Tanacetum coccineum]
MMQDADRNRDSISAKDAEVQEAKAALFEMLEKVGNLVHDSEPISKDEFNIIILVLINLGKQRCELYRVEPKLKNHVELVELLGIADLKKGANVAGGRGYYLKRVGVCLNQALINFGLYFLEKKGYTALHTPFFMRKYIMAKCAQLAQFDEELYKVTYERFAYLIACLHTYLGDLTYK